MKKALRLMIALLFFVGMANAQQITIDFEDGTIPSSMSNDATYPWTVINILSTTNGSHCIQSGNSGIDDSQSSISYQMSYTQAGYIAFDANCMGEGLDYDVCQFYIDGDLQFQHGEEEKGWHTYGYNVPAGSHTFTWTYRKDGSYDPVGDCFQVDNIIVGFGAACVAPDEIKMVEMNQVSWNGMADSYTLRYKKGSGAWQTITDITTNEYDFTSLGLRGNYTVEVKADCNGSYTASAQFHFVESYENWYGFSMGEVFYHFRCENLEQVTEASEIIDEVYSSAFVNGEVWMVQHNTSTGYNMICKAPINIWNHTIGTVEIVKEDFSYEYTLMAYNPANGLIYCISDCISDAHLKSFNPTNPTAVTDYGAMYSGIDAFAINREGQAYVTVGSEFRSLDLNNGQMTYVDDMYMEGNYLMFSTMCFDWITGELFGIYNGDYLMYIDPATVNTTFVGDIRSDYMYYFNTIFMTYDWDAISESEVESVNVYPNPAQGQITVEGSGRMVISNVLGQEILSQEIDGKATIELPQGMYIVRLNNAISKVVVE